MKLFRYFAMAAMFAAPGQKAAAVYELVVIEKPLHARSVSGIALDSAGQRLPGAEVNEYDRGFSKILGSTTTDIHGHFALPRNDRSVHYLRIYARGMNPLQFIIALRPFANAGVTVRVPIGG